jgi:hypothetical protein
VKYNLKYIECCPYCNSDIIYVDSIKIYRRSHGMIYLCSDYPLCMSWVGVHPGTHYPLGRLANKELRKLKKIVHSWFDPIWKYLLKSNIINPNTNELFWKHEARNDTYKWLAFKMNIKIDDCHIGMFDIEQCKQAIEIIKSFYTLKLKKFKQLPNNKQ